MCINNRVERSDTPGTRPPATIGTPRGVRESAARGIGVGCERRETPFVQRNIGERAVSAYLEYGAVRRFPMRCEAATARCSRAPARHDVPPIDLNGHFRPVSRFSTTRSRTPLRVPVRWGAGVPGVSLRSTPG
jgi:hypothetical protein